MHCGEVFEGSVVGFKAVCEGCGMYLHSCVQCRLYDEARRCLSNTTEAVRDVEHANFCEEYQPLEDSAEQTGWGRQEGGSSGERASDDFDALFGH
jgi:hypothetical protein